MIKKNILFGFIAIAMIFIIGNVHAYYVDVDYAYVRSDTFTQFQNVQFSNYYDNIDFSYQLTGYGFSGNQKIYVSPVIYGIAPNGYVSQVMAVPTSSIYLYSANPYTYVYNNLFYFDSDYLGYKIQLNVTDETGNQLSNDLAYIYSSGTNPGNTGNNNNNNNNNSGTPTCNDFYLSGQSDIYLQEDDSSNYYLYLINTIDKELTVTSVTTTNPNELDIDNIDYPYTVGSYGTRSANIEMTSNTVDSDYSSSFDVTVNARYDNLTCSKTYVVYYHIEDQQNSSNADCSDISFANTNITMDELDTETKEITIENNSNDYDYVIEDVSAKDSANINAEVTYNSNEIRRDSTGKVRIRLETEEISNYLTEDIKLTLNGYMKRSGHEDKHCKKYLDVPVRINNNGSNNTGTGNECSQIEVHTSSISQKENTNKDYTNSNGFYILNRSGSKFNISEVSITDNSNYSDITKNTMNYAINANSQTSINFNLKTLPVNDTVSSRAGISVLGRFENGISCTYSDIQGSFTINNLDSSDMCSNIIVQDKKVIAGTNNITIQNNTNQEFGVNDLIILNKNGLNVNVIDKATTIRPNSYKELRVGVTGDGSADLHVMGKFKDGDTCDYTRTTPGTITTKTSIDFQAGECDFEINYPITQTISNARETLNLTFQNNSQKGGSISLSTYGAVVDTPIIYLEGYDDFTRTLTLSNFNNPTYVVYDVKLNGCQEKIYTTKLTSTITSDKKILITSSPTIITPTKTRTLGIVSVLNTYNSEKNVTLKLAGLPDTWKIYESENLLNVDLIDNYTKTTSRYLIGNNQTKNIYFGIIMPENAEKTKYNAYFELYDEDKLISKTPVTIDLTPILSDVSVTSKSLVSVNDFQNAYTLSMTLKNNSKVSKDIEIVFMVDENIVIDGNKLFTIDPTDTNKIVEYKIVTKNKLDSNSSIPFNVIDKKTNKVILNDSISYSEVDSIKKRAGLTAFFTFTSASKVIGIIVIAIIIILVVWYLVRRARRKGYEKGVQTKLKLGN